MLKLFGKLFILIVILSAAGLGYRYAKNPPLKIPLPYELPQAQPVEVDASVMIIGDRMGNYLQQFHVHLNEVISRDLEKPIQITGLAKEQTPLHRTLNQLKSISKWPQILIYQGASEEWKEKIFESKEVKSIRKNFALYQNDNIRSLLILFPKLSRFLYEPIKRIKLEDSLQSSKVDHLNPDNLENLSVHYLLFEEHLKELIFMAEDKNSLLILTTTPINLNIAPKSVCSFLQTTDAQTQLVDLKKALNRKDFKSAYQIGKEALSNHPDHAPLLHFTGKAAMGMGRSDEGLDYLLKATATDCTHWRAQAIYNSMIKKVAQENKVILFDFAKMVNQEDYESAFMDDLYPEQKYYLKATDQLGRLIKGILKL